MVYKLWLIILKKQIYFSILYFFNFLNFVIVDEKIVFEIRVCFNPLPTILHSLLGLTAHSPTDQFVTKVRLAYIPFLSHSILIFF